MRLSVYIAGRYLFTKRSHNAINIISLVSVCGVSVATIAIVCALSVLNGFQSLVSDMFSAFDPELKVAPLQGKVFDPSAVREKLVSIPGIELVSASLEENVYIRYRERQVPATMRGVEENFSELTDIEGILLDGDLTLEDEVNSYALLGIGLASNLGANARFVHPMEVYAPRRNVALNPANPSAAITSSYVYIGGVFMVNQTVYDENYILVPIGLARTLLDYETEVSALAIKIKEGVKESEIQRQIKEAVGEGFTVTNRYEQQEAAFKMMNIEKWVIFLFLCFVTLIAVFNVIGSLSMLMIEKQADIMTLRNLGADNKLISGIFLFEGWMISALGAVSGIILGTLICLGQSHFGWIKLGTGGNFAVESYPVVVSPADLIIVFVTVLAIGFLSVLYPVNHLSKKWLT